MRPFAMREFWQVQHILNCEKVAVLSNNLAEWVNNCRFDRIIELTQHSTQ
jgi:hypothetical protein